VPAEFHDHIPGIYDKQRMLPDCQLSTCPDKDWHFLISGRITDYIRMSGIGHASATLPEYG